MNVDLITRLIEAGTPPALVAEVAAELARGQAANDIVDRRREKDRARKVPRNSTESEESAEIRDRPLSLSPNEINSNPHTHTPEHKPRARKEGFALPAHIPAAEWEGYVDMRRRIGKPMTDYAKRLAVGELDKLAADGWPPGPVLNQSTMNSYQGLFAPKDQGKRNGNRPANDRSGANLLDRLRADDAAAGLA